MSNIFPDEAFEAVLSAIANGSSIEAACKQTIGCNKATFYRRLRSNPDLSKRLTNAMEERAAVREQRYNDVLDKLEEGRIDPSSARVLLDGIKFQLQNDDRRYQEKIRQELTGKDGAPLIESRPTDDMDTARFFALALYQSGVRSLKDLEPAALLEARSS